jgi:hypothetical protein
VTRPDRELAKRDKRRAIAQAHLPEIPDTVPATPRERGYDACPCPKNCTLHGECRLCTAYHARKGALPRCER